MSKNGSRPVAGSRPRRAGSRPAPDTASQALRRSEEFLRSLVTTAADAIVTVDEHGVIDTFNRAAERMFGYSSAEVVGQHVRLLTPPPEPDEEGFIEGLLRTATSIAPETGREAIGRRRDGTTFPIEVSISEIDHQRRFVGVLRDLTERRNLEWRLAESQLEERRHMARELHDEIGGHMTGIGLLAQSVLVDLERAQSPMADRVRELVSSIGDAQQRLRTVIRGLMPVDEIPEGLMAALGELARRAETMSGIPCGFRCDEPVHVIDTGTAKHLFRIAQEAVNNAVRHAQASRIEIRLLQDAGRLIVEVTDDGIGPGRPQPGHTGIGLASMAQRAHLLGGECTVRGRSLGGTNVRCWVPLANGRTVLLRPSTPAAILGGVESDRSSAAAAPPGGAAGGQ